MSLTVVLAVGLDSLLPTHESPVWKSPGYIFVGASSIRAAIEQFNVGDFDLVLLGRSMTMEHKERLTLLIRASGSRTPVVCIASDADGCVTFADGPLQNDSSALLAGIQKLLAKQPGKSGAPTIQRAT